MAKQKVAEGTMFHLDPKAILADDNIRFGLDASRIQSLANDILDKGGVMAPVEVAPITPANGHTHRLTAGFYRLAAVMLLNEATGAGLTIPAILHTNETDIERLKRQVAENRERKDLSPMDTAIAIRRMLDAGMSKIDVRTEFSRPSTAKQGGKAQPASNAWVNMHLSFLDLPDTIKAAIHSGMVGLETAYYLTTLPDEKREAVLAKAQADAAAAAALEEKREEKFTKEAQREEEEAKKAAEETEKLTKIQTMVDVDASALKAAADVTTEAYKKVQAAKDAKERKEAQAAFTKLEKERVGLQAKLTASKKDLAKVAEAREKREQLLAERRAKIDEARSKGTTATKVTKTQVAKAAKETGAAASHTPLTLNQVRELFKDLMLAGSPDKVRTVASIFHDAIMGITEEKAMFKALLAFTGEGKKK